ncbi:ribosome silencing factor [Jannaschia sp. S6380]|uniref:ribosome silencing factor n=1 Tax=Jannaschia sp. S6380 TaxID=2926408 RepID=UPI001FF3C9A5|nr:ribosome silencing factor [Jannaschia sp. S6380]MCK0168651.1 ribosome silencing factor [Jannaschia sp. S6380]
MTGTHCPVTDPVLACFHAGPPAPTIPEDRTLPAETQLPTDRAQRPTGDTRASDETLALILTSLDEEKAEEIVQIDLRGKSTVADHMVVCSGRSTRQVTALAEKLTERLKSRLGRTARTEGKGQGDWVLLDAGDVIVHIFRPEVREFYQLEKMWQDPAADQPARPA